MTSGRKRNCSQHCRIRTFSNRSLRPSNAEGSFTGNPDVQKQEPIASKHLEAGSSVLHHLDRQGMEQEQGSLGKFEQFELPKDGTEPTFEI
jgi:hypothetical protein